MQYTSKPNPLIQARILRLSKMMDFTEVKKKNLRTFNEVFYVMLKFAISTPYLKSLYKMSPYTVSLKLFRIFFMYTLDLQLRNNLADINYKLRFKLFKLNLYLRNKNYYQNILVILAKNFANNFSVYYTIFLLFGLTCINSKFNKLLLFWSTKYFFNNLLFNLFNYLNPAQQLILNKYVMGPYILINHNF